MLRSTSSASCRLPSAICDCVRTSSASTAASSSSASASPDRGLSALAERDGGAVVGFQPPDGVQVNGSTARPGVTPAGVIIAPGSIRRPPVASGAGRWPGMYVDS